MGIINFEALKEAYEENLEELLLVFKEDADDDLESLVKAIEDKDHDQIKNYAHKMKGSSMIVMDDTLQQLTSEIETNHTDMEVIKPMIEQLKSHYPLISKEIEDFLG